MAITLIDITESSGSSTSITTDVPTHQENDLLIWGQSNQNATALTEPTDWDLVQAANGTACAGAVWWKWASASEPSNYSVSSPNGKSQCFMAAFRGVDLTTPFDASTPSPVTDFDAGEESIVMPGITTVTANAWVLGVPIGVTASGVGPSDFTGTNADAIEYEAWSNASGANVGIALLREILVSAGSFTPTVTNSPASIRNIGITFALRPSVGGGGGPNHYVKVGGVWVPSTVKNRVGGSWSNADSKNRVSGSWS